MCMIFFVYFILYFQKNAWVFILFDSFLLKSIERYTLVECIKPIDRRIDRQKDRKAERKQRNGKKVMFVQSNECSAYETHWFRSRFFLLFTSSSSSFFYSAQPYFHTFTIIYIYSNGILHFFIEKFSLLLKTHKLCST